METLNFSFEVGIQGVPKGICRKIVDESFHLYYQKYGDEMTESEHDEYMEVVTSILVNLFDETIDLEQNYNDKGSSGA